MNHRAASASKGKIVNTREKPGFRVTHESSRKCSGRSLVANSSIPHPRRAAKGSKTGGARICLCVPASPRAAALLARWRALGHNEGTQAREREVATLSIRYIRRRNVEGPE